MRKSKIFTTRNVTCIIFFSVLFSYFIYHAINGERGIAAFLQLTKKVEQSQQELDIVRAEKLQIEHRVSLLRPESLDLDLLDEQSRRILGYANEDEVIYTVNP